MQVSVQVLALIWLLTVSLAEALLSFGLGSNAKTLKSSILDLAERTNRGLTESASDRDEMLEMFEKLEKLNKKLRKTEAQIIQVSDELARLDPDIDVNSIH